MKRSIISLVAILFTIICAAQSTNDPLSATSSDHLLFSPVLGADHAVVASAAYNEKMMAGYGSREAMRCAHYENMKVAGIVLSAIGGALIVGGAVMVAVGNNQNNNNYYYYNNVGYYGRGYYSGVPPLVAGGATCIAFGIGGLALGLPLAIVGSVRVRRFCRGSDHYIGRSYIELHSQGSGLAMNF